MRHLIFLWPVTLMVFLVGAMIVVVVVLAGEPTQKAPDDHYDTTLWNRMRLEGIPPPEINYLLSLPTAPEVDLDDFSLIDSTQWFFVSPDLSVGVVFTLTGDCKVQADIVYDGRRNQKDANH